MNRSVITRTILFLCGLFSYCSLIRPAAGAESTPGKIWYLCVAGLDVYRYTYGFESGVYKICNKIAGRNKENVIVISPDTAAYHAKNYLPGALVHGEREISDEINLNNVYADIEVTYNFKNITKQLLYAILYGNKRLAKHFGGEKVLESGPEDTIVMVFINYGDYGLMTLTNKNTDILEAEEFIPFIENLIAKKKFKKMLIMMEGETPGSMFDGYVCENCNILVMTSGARRDNLELCKWNRNVAAFTATCHSLLLAQYLESIKKADLQTLTFFDLFQEVRRRSKSWRLDSISNLYGHLSMGNLLLKEFFTF